jgi:hypothetical protein
MSEHPAQYARDIINKELDRLGEQLSVLDKAKDADLILELNKKMDQLEMADFCLHMEL